MALATQPDLWPSVDSFSKGPGLADVLLKTLGKKMGKEEQCSDWSQELTLSQLHCESRLPNCAAGFQPVFSDGACDVQAGLEIFEHLSLLVGSISRPPCFRDSYTFHMVDGNIVFMDKIDIDGTPRHVQWKMYSREFDEAHGIVHVPHLQDRDNKAAAKRLKAQAKRKAQTKT